MDVSAIFEHQNNIYYYFIDQSINAGPQIVFSLYGPNWWGTESSKGYARIHVPPGGQQKTIRAPILVAKCSNVWSAISSWFTDRNPELRDPKILLDGNKSKGNYTSKSKIDNYFPNHA